MRVFVSPVLIPSSTSRRVDIHLHHTRRVAVAFARWNFLLRAAKKKQRRKIYCMSLQQNNSEGFIGAP